MISPNGEKKTQKDFVVDMGVKASRNVKSPGGLRKENYNIKTTGSIKNRVRAGIGGSMVFPPTM